MVDKTRYVGKKFYILISSFHTEIYMSTNVNFDCLDANETKIALTLDKLQNSGFKICIFGTGPISKTGFKFLKEKCFVNIDCFCDNSSIKQGTKIDEIPIISPEELEKNKNNTACVVFDQISHLEIKKQIVNMGVAHLVPIDLTKPSINKDLEYIKTILFLQNFAPKLLKKMYSGFDIDNNITYKVAPYAFCGLRQRDNEHIQKLLMYLMNGIGISPKIAFNIINKVSKNPSLSESAFFPLWTIALIFPKSTEYSKSLENLYNELNSDNIDIHIRYIILLLKQNKEQQALSILQKHIKKISEESICSWLPLAEFAYRIGILKSKKLELPARVFRTLKNNMKNNILKELITGKSIAVVGNGPQEIGKKSGTEIDSHDIVVRFNHYNTGEPFSVDYGKKTDVHVFAMSVTPNWGKNIKIFAINQPYRRSCPQGLLNSFAHAPLDKLVYIGTDETLAGIYRNYCIGGPSSGAKTIYHLKMVLKANLHKKDIFGMALSGGKVENGEYHHDRPMILKDICFETGRDNFYAEFEMYKHLFRNDN